MKKYVFMSVYILLFLSYSSLIFAEQKNYRIEALQVTSIDQFQNTYKGFLDELEKNGIIQNKNLIVNRTVIDFDVEKAGLWKKISVLMRIKSEASRIVNLKPDLVLTIGTPATKYGKDKIIDAGIPLVFSAVAYPPTVGCKSLTEAGPGFTGATLHMNMDDRLKIVKLAFPNIKTIGIVYSDDDSAIAHVEEAKQFGPSMGLTFITKEVSKNDSVTPAAQELISKRAQAFVIPLDTYYGLRNNEASLDIGELSRNTKIPVISFSLFKFPGAVMYMGSDFYLIGSLSGGQAVKILKEGVKPDALPVMKQKDLKILVDTKTIKSLNIQLPLEILQLAQDVE